MPSMRLKYLSLILVFLLLTCSFPAMIQLDEETISLPSSPNLGTVSNHSGFVTEVNPSLCEPMEYFGVENTTIFYLAACDPLDSTISNIFSKNFTTETNILNVSGWELEDAVYLENGTILFALNRYTSSTVSRTPFSGSNYDSYSFVIGYLLPNGTIGELPNSLSFDMGVHVKFDMYGNAFLIGSASTRSQTATIGTTSLSWTSVGSGTGCWSVAWFSPKFIAHYNYSSLSFDWVFKSNYVTPDWLNGAGLGINKATSVLFFVVTGTAQQSYQCGSTPGTHSFGTHSTSSGQIVGAVGQSGTFLYAYNPTISIQSIGSSGHFYYYPQPIGNDSFVVEKHGEGGSNIQDRIFFNSTTHYIVPSDAPSSCNYQTNTSYLIGGNATNYTSNSTTSVTSPLTIHVEKTRDYAFHYRSWCLASSSSMLVVDRENPSPSNYNTFTYILMNDDDGDDFADLIDDFPSESTQWFDSDNDGWGDNWGQNSWNLTRTGGIGEWVMNAQRIDECPLTLGTSQFDRGGCIDNDGDGYSDDGDEFPNEQSQWDDTDGDGYGGNQSGLRGDSCPLSYGESTRDRFGCLDSDYDGWSDFSDIFPSLSSQWNDTDGDGYGDEYSGFQGDVCPNQFGNSTNDRFGCLDSDGDGHSNLNDDFANNPTQYLDSDGDGYGNNQTPQATMSDAFPNDGTQWNDTDGDGHGDNPYGTLGDWFPNDPLRWQDSDQDGYADEDDAFINDVSQWNDTDGDGYGDEANGNRPDEFPNDPLEWQDSDGDGYGNNGDAFPVDGTQWNDTDADGHGDNPYGTLGDWFPDDPNRWQDSDRDGFADENDAFANDETQWNDTDGDGYGDNINGSNADVFPNDSSEWKDTDEDGIGNNADEYPFDPTQHIDSDGDGYGDNSNGTRGDVFPEDPMEWMDIDGDGYGDNGDAFSSDGTQWNDSDGDGYGDNLNGANGDSCPEISGNSSLIILGCLDTDGDGYADIIDAFISNAQSWSDVDGDLVPDELDAYPNDATQSFDSDGDGFGDDPLGTNADKFPNDATQWNDIDGDGFGDNLEGNNPDLFKTDATQWADQDGDGYGDNPAGRLYDLFPDNPTQWEDADGDGFGDNQSGTDADPYLEDFDNDGYNDSVDILPKLPSPGDLDADGCLDEVDEFVDNAQECVDTDGDGVGDNADSDDDGDGWTDADEQRLNTDPLSSGEQPVDSFEIVVPGTAVGLGAWDLIGIFGGVPFFIWIAFGFVTRNTRCQKYEVLLKQANSREELVHVAHRWEYSLMLRMLGPHQGIRLERLRAELDDEFEFAQKLGTDGKPEQQHTPVEESAKTLPSLTYQQKPPSAPPKETPATSVDQKGYEWLKDENNVDWYRVTDSADEWQQFEGQLLLFSQEEHPLYTHSWNACLDGTLS